MFGRFKAFIGVGNRYIPRKLKKMFVRAYLKITTSYDIDFW